MSSVITSWKAPEILIALLGGGYLQMRDLQMAVGGSNTTIQNKVKLLFEEGYVKERWEKSKDPSKYWRKRILELTPKGVAAAKQLKKLSDMAGLKIKEVSR